MTHSIIDTDLYKLTMQQAIHELYPDVEVTYKFTNRSPQMLFTKPCFDWIQQQVLEMQNLTLTPSEQTYLTSVPYFTPKYIAFLAALRLDPANQVTLSFVPKQGQGGEEVGEIDIAVKGKWEETILYEVPIMSIVSEGYFQFVDTDWSPSLPSTQAAAKAKILRILTPPSSTAPSPAISEFGTRRRRSYAVHEAVLKGLIEGDREWRDRVGEGAKGGLGGTSNVHFAHIMGLRPIGTIAHEWIMGIGAMEGYVGVNGRAMDLWEQVYPASNPANAPLKTMLTDTYTTSTFFTDFSSAPPRAHRWTGLRHDSGDPLIFAEDARAAWVAVGEPVVPRGEGRREMVGGGKRVVFSDGLDEGEVGRIGKGCDEIGIEAAYGIGTYLTNDFHSLSSPTRISKPLNIVIKLRTIGGAECVKLSEDRGKETGEVEAVRRCKAELGLE